MKVRHIVDSSAVDKGMNKPAIKKPDYGNWVPTRFINVSGIAGLLFLGVALMFPILIIIAVFCFLVSIYFAYARYQFSPRGGDVQEKIWELVLSNLDWNGEGQALDIGCGNAPLTIKLALKHKGAHIVGIDHWGKRWEYSKEICEKNVVMEGVAGRVSFKKASASKLPFEDGYFDSVVSNFVFHEVGDAKDKREVIREALRVVRKGGCFAFQDLFLFKRIYGEIDELRATIKSWGITKVEFLKTCEAPFIPKALKLPFMLGTIGIISGKK
jgi:ubiquinone/menaquinone biosynthesis C-methylase UbiE